jgi:hypothetical protein
LPFRLSSCLMGTSYLPMTWLSNGIDSHTSAAMPRWCNRHPVHVAGDVRRRPRIQRTNARIAHNRDSRIRGSIRGRPSPPHHRAGVMRTSST